MDDIKILDIVVCPFVCMSGCVYKVGQYQNFRGVPYKPSCVYSRNDGGDDEGEADEAGVVGALLAPRRVLRLLGELRLPHLHVEAVQGRVSLRGQGTIPSFPTSDIRGSLVQIFSRGQIRTQDIICLC